MQVKLGLNRSSALRFREGWGLRLFGGVAGKKEGKGLVDSVLGWLDMAGI